MQLRRAILIGIVLGHALGLTLSPGRAHAQAANGMVISQLQAGGAGSGHASDEFIELYNAAAMPLSLDRWSLQYRSGSASGDCTQSWSTKLTLPSSIVIPAQTYWLAAATGYNITADGHFSAGLASTKGAVRLIDATGQQVDALAWGGAACGLGSSAPAPPDGQSLQRLAGINNGNNLTDFNLQSSPLPRSSSTVSAPVVSYPDLELTEIAVGSGSFIELHNPNDTAVQVSAYGLALGSSVYHLLPSVLAADGYLAIPSSTSGLVADVAGGQVVLTDPTGAVIDRSDAWPTTDGGTWALSADGWQWTSLATPGSANQFPLAVAPDEDTAPIIDTGSISVELSEIMPNPSVALNGAMEKYVELHNIGNDPVVLDGYGLRSGANLGNHETIAHLTIQPGAYVVLPLSVTRLSLAVGGSKVGLFDPSGNLVGNTVSYGKAPLGQAYAKFADGWHWTTVPTPNAANVLVVPPAAVAKAKAAKAVKAAKAKQPAKPKKTKKTKLPKTKLVKVTPASFATATQAPNGRWLLFILGGLTMIYISYEFRLDLQHHYHRARAYLRTRRQARRKPTGSDDPGADQ